MPKEPNDLVTWYCHIGSQWGRVSKHVWAEILGNEGGMGGVGPSRMKM